MSSCHQRIMNRTILGLFTAGILLLPSACANKPDWAAKNEKLIAAKNLTVRTRDDIAAVRLKPSLADGVVTPIAKLPEIVLAPGVKARLYWGKGNLVAWLTFEPGRDDPPGNLDVRARHGRHERADQPAHWREPGYDARRGSRGA